MDWKEKIQNPNELLNPMYKQQTQRDMPIHLPSTLHHRLLWSEGKAQQQQHKGLKSLVPYSGAHTCLSSASERNDFIFLKGLFKKKVIIVGFVLVEGDRFISTWLSMY